MLKAQLLFIIMILNIWCRNSTCKSTFALWRTSSIAACCFVLLPKIEMLHNFTTACPLSLSLSLLCVHFFRWLSWAAWCHLWPWHNHARCVYWHSCAVSLQAPIRTGHLEWHLARSHYLRAPCLGLDIELWDLVTPPHWYYSSSSLWSAPWSWSFPCESPNITVINRQLSHSSYGSKLWWQAEWYYSIDCIVKIYLYVLGNRVKNSHVSEMQEPILQKEVDLSRFLIPKGTIPLFNLFLLPCFDVCFVSAYSTHTIVELLTAVLCLIFCFDRVLRSAGDSTGTPTRTVKR